MEAVEHGGVTGAKVSTEGLNKVDRKNQRERERKKCIA